MVTKKRILAIRRKLRLFRLRVEDASFIRKTSEEVGITQAEVIHELIQAYLKQCAEISWKRAEISWKRAEISTFRTKIAGKRTKIAIYTKNRAIHIGRFYVLRI